TSWLLHEEARRPVIDPLTSVPCPWASPASAFHQQAVEPYGHLQQERGRPCSRRYLAPGVVTAKFWAGDGKVMARHGPPPLLPGPGAGSGRSRPRPGSGTPRFGSCRFVARRETLSHAVLELIHEDLADLIVVQCAGDRRELPLRDPGAHDRPRLAHRPGDPRGHAGGD